MLLISACRAFEKKRVVVLSGLQNVENCPQLEKKRLRFFVGGIG
jgi:hypothetical protein